MTSEARQAHGRQSHDLHKAIVVSEATRDALTAHLAELDLPRRALSWPVDAAPPPALPSFCELWGPEAKLREIVARWPFPGRGWLVDEHVPVDYARTWRSGEPSPGLRMISTLHRRPDLSRAAFAAHWLGPHVEVATAFTIPIWRYVQNVVREPLDHDGGHEGSRDGDIDADARVDGFVGMHFETEAALRARWRDHPEEAARGAEDARRFMAVERSVGITAIEIVWYGTIADGPASPRRSSA